MDCESGAGSDQGKALIWGPPPPAVEAMDFSPFYRGMLRAGALAYTRDSRTKVRVEAFGKTFDYTSRMLSSEIVGPTWGVRYTKTLDRSGYAIAFAGSLDDFIVDIVALRMYLS